MKAFGKFTSVASREINYKGEKRVIYPSEFVAGNDTFIFDIWANEEYVKRQGIRTDTAGDIELEFEKRTYYDKQGHMQQQQSIRFKSFRPANMATQRFVAAMEPEPQAAPVSAQPDGEDNNMPF